MTTDDIQRITGKLFMTDGDQARNVNNFWVLLLLSGVISAVGVVADSTATVIGAMIVAPLMTPILGSALALVLADRAALRRSLVLVLGGAASVIAVGFMVGLIIQQDVTSATTDQVAGRVSPRLLDLIGAIATGLVGAYALMRSEVADTLPGVAIAISLVPPLAVVGLTLESGAYGEAFGALALFGTNVSAIIATGTALMLASGVREAARESEYKLGMFRDRTLVLVIAMLAVYVIPLGYGSYTVAQEQILISNTQSIANEWAEANDWTVEEVAVINGTLTITAVGLPPEIGTDTLRTRLDDADLGDVDVKVNLVLGGTAEFSGDES